jgi:hypothetical protein
MSAACHAAVCAFCGRPTLTTEHVCQDCAKQEDLPPCIGAAYQEKLDLQFAHIFGVGKAE